MDFGEEEEEVSGEASEEEECESFSYFSFRELGFFFKYEKGDIRDSKEIINRGF